MSETNKEKYMRLTRELDAVAEREGNESEAAEAVREQMEEPWYAMTEDEQNECRLEAEKL